MIKSTFKTLSLSLITLAASAGAVPLDNTRVACAAKAEIDRGWEDQQRLVEQREAEKAAEGLSFPGAIVVPPFKSYAPYRKDVPAVVTAHKVQKAQTRSLDEPATRH